MILIRHGQSHFNVHYGATRQDPGIVDPGLTEDGVAQAQTAAQDLARHDISRIIASPYSRTLQTANIIAAELDLVITVETLVRERAYFTCDIGSPRSQLSTEWPDLEFGDLPERWWPSSESEDELLGRCQRFRTTMAATTDWSRVLVVTHWGFIRGLTGQEVQNAAIVTFDPTTA
jgi:broad specificity phosphatase PhoE